MVTRVAATEIPSERDAREAIDLALAQAAVSLPDFAGWAARWQSGEDRSFETVTDLHRQLADLTAALGLMNRAVYQAARAAGVRRAAERQRRH